MAKSDLYQETTDSIIAALEAGPDAWQRNWRSSRSSVARNHVTSKPYRGMNAVRLAIECMLRGCAVNRWATFKQAQAKGASVKKGSKGVALSYYKVLPNKAKEGQDEATGSHLMMSRFYVFNVADIDGFDTYTEVKPEGGATAPGEEHLGMRIIRGSEAKIGLGEPAYIPSLDEIRLPTVESFDTTDGYLATAFHELCHWTGHKDRCDRDLKNRFGDEKYAMEELVAELGSAMLSSVAGVDHISQASKYLAHWLKVLKADKRAIFTASSKAQQAADFLLAKAGYVDASDKDESEEEEEASKNAGSYSTVLTGV